MYLVIVNHYGTDALATLDLGWNNDCRFWFWFWLDAQGSHLHNWWRRRRGWGWRRGRLKRA
jgi:hypothetical protein